MIILILHLLKHEDITKQSNKYNFVQAYLLIVNYSCDFRPSSFETENVPYPTSSQKQ